MFQCWKHLLFLCETQVVIREWAYFFKKKCTRETYSHVLKNVMPRRSTSSSFVLLLHRVFLLFCTKLYFTLLYSRLLTPWHPLQNIFLVRVHSCFFLVWKHLFLCSLRWRDDEEMKQNEQKYFLLSTFMVVMMCPMYEAEGTHTEEEKLQSIKK